MKYALAVSTLNKTFIGLSLVLSQHTLVAALDIVDKDLGTPEHFKMSL